MSQYPPDQGPISYYTPAVPPPKPRPTSVTVVAVISIILGSIGVLGMICAIPQYLGMSPFPNKMLDEMRNDPIWLAYAIATLVLGSVLCIAQLWAGIEWGIPGFFLLR